MKIDSGNFLLVFALAFWGVAGLLWIIGNPNGRIQRWADRTKLKDAEALRLAQQRRESEARGDEEMLWIREIADRELERLHSLSKRNKQVPCAGFSHPSDRAWTE